MAQLANAYIELSSDAEDLVPKLNPIVSITNNRGKVIYEKEQDISHKKKRIIPRTVSYMIRQILSNI